MSFPADDDAAENDKSSQWISFESEQIRRLHDSVIATAELLKSDSRGLAEAERAPPGQHLADDDGIQLAGVPDFYFAIEPAPSQQRLPALRTTMTPPSAADIDDWFGLAMMLKLGAAAGLAVGVALTILPQGQIGFGGAQDSLARSQIFSMAALSGLAEISSAQAKVEPEPPVMASAVVAAAQANTDIAKESAASEAAPASTKAAAIVPEPAPASTAPEVAPVPAPAVAEAPSAAPMPAHPASALASDEAAALLKRGRNLLAAGDIASARLILTRLADNGEAEASLLLAGTFDPTELARLHVIGVTPDVAQARAWYAKAAEQGSSEGSRRLQQAALN
jgi:hypothetical protein